MDLQSLLQAMKLFFAQISPPPEAQLHDPALPSLLVVLLVIERSAAPFYSARIPQSRQGRSGGMSPPSPRARMPMRTTRKG